MNHSPPPTELETPAPSHPLRWFPELLELGRRRLRPQARLLGLSLLTGVVSGLGAIVFYAACQFVTHFTLDAAAGYHPHPPGGEPPLWSDTATALQPWLLLLVPTLGGLVSGILVYSLAPEAEGHGTDAAIAAYHHHDGLIRPRVPMVKLISSAITIGTGGSGGREGPIAQIGAGFGSFIGGLLRLGPAQRRVLMAAGMGAGVAAIFRAPLAGALFAAEVLYRSPDFESEAIIPAALASVTAYCTFGAVFGWTPLFDLSPDLLAVLTFDAPIQLVSYTVLALFLVVLAMLYTRSFYGMTHLFRRLPIRPHFKPAIGAFLTGAIGVGLYYAFGGNQQLLAVMSSGYGSIQDSMTVAPEVENSLLLALVFMTIALGKIVTTGLTIGSGGSGGVFGPSMVIGGCGGGAVGIFLHWLAPVIAPHPANFVIVGMAGFFAAAAKTPFSTLVMVGELTGNYNLLLPTLWVCMIAFLLSDEQSLYSSQVESRSLSPAHRGDYVRDVLAGLTVAPFLTPLKEVPVLREADTLDTVVTNLDNSPFTALPVLDAAGSLLGVICREDVQFAARFPSLAGIVLLSDLLRDNVEPLRLADQLDKAMERFAEHNLLELPVVDEASPPSIVGIVKRRDVLSAYLRQVHGPKSLTS